MISIALAVLLFVHGFAHFPGFLVPWRLATLAEMPYKTTVLAGSVDVGHWGIRFFAVLWLMAAVGFVICGTATLARAPWWFPATVSVSVFSLVLCSIGWPDSRIGIYVNVALLAAMLGGRHLGKLL